MSCSLRIASKTIRKGVECTCIGEFDIIHERDRSCERKAINCLKSEDHTEITFGSR